MNKFEVVLLFSPDLVENSIKENEIFFSKSINEMGGKIVAEENWGLKDLSYKIYNHQKAYYKFYQIEIDGSRIPEIKKNLNHNEKFIRNLFVKTKDHQILPTKMMNS